MRPSSHRRSTLPRNFHPYSRPKPEARPANITGLSVGIQKSAVPSSLVSSFVQLIFDSENPVVIQESSALDVLNASEETKDKSEESYENSIEQRGRRHTITSPVRGRNDDPKDPSKSGSLRSRSASRGRSAKAIAKEYFAGISRVIRAPSTLLRKEPEIRQEELTKPLRSRSLSPFKSLRSKKSVRFRTEDSTIDSPVPSEPIDIPDRLLPTLPALEALSLGFDDFTPVHEDLGIALQPPKTPVLRPFVSRSKIIKSCSIRSPLVLNLTEPSSEPSSLQLSTTGFPLDNALEAALELEDSPARHETLSTGQSTASGVKCLNVENDHSSNRDSVEISPLLRPSNFIKETSQRYELLKMIVVYSLFDLLCAYIVQECRPTTIDAIPIPNEPIPEVEENDTRSSKMALERVKKAKVYILTENATEPKLYEVSDVLQKCALIDHKQLVTWREGSKSRPTEKLHTEKLPPFYPDDSESAIDNYQVLFEVNGIENAYFDQHRWSPFEENAFPTALFSNLGSRVFSTINMLCKPGGFYEFWHQAELPEETGPDPDTQAVCLSEVFAIIWFTIEEEFGPLANPVQDYPPEERDELFYYFERCGVIRRNGPHLERGL